MRTENTQCALQRFITHSEYDHIGLVVRFADNQVKIFEANADDGVNLYDWDQFQSSFHCY
jgi:glyoxylase-like metal-dependent hydrolase (beta-lactamase superfamily II)